MECLNCQKELSQTPGKRAKQFCDTTCRSNYWQKKKKLPEIGIEEAKELIKDIKPAAIASECAGKETITVTSATPPSTFGYALAGDGKILSSATTKQIESAFEYCSNEGITLDELVEQHKSFKKELNARKQAKNDAHVLDSDKASLQNTSGKGLNAYDLGRRKTKLGF